MIFDSLYLWLLLAFIFLYFTSERVIRKLPIDKLMPKEMFRLGQVLSGMRGQLIPWKNQEIELLSLNQSHVDSSHKKGLETKGYFTSIYQEPIFSYAYKSFPHKPKYAILHAQTHHHEFYYYQHPTEVVVQVNGVEMGRLIDGKLYGTDGRLLAHFLNNNLENHTTIVVSNKDVAHLLPKGGTNNSVNPRALEFVSPDMNAEEMTIMKALAIWHIVKHHVAGVN